MGLKAQFNPNYHGHLSVALLSLIAFPAVSQQTPDAGSILRQQPQQPAPQPLPATPPQTDRPAATPPDAGPRVLVKTIRVTGSTLISAEELVAQLASMIGKEFSVAELQRAGLTLTGYYAKKGYLARVTLPPQEIRDGLLEYRVTEGVRGNLTVNKSGERIDAERVRRFIDARVAQGANMEIAALGEALTILGEQPGVDVKSSLTLGKAEREIDIALIAADKPLLGYSLGLNNQGSLATGVLQASAGVTVANPTGRFDALSFATNASQGTLYGRADYSIAAGDRGMRVGLNASVLKYKLVQSSFAALQPEGTAQTVGVTLSYPLALRADSSLRLSAGLEQKKLVDRTVTGETGNRTVQVANLGVSGYRVQADGVLSGVQLFGASLVSGNASQRNAAALAADQTGRRTEGGFSKLGWNLGLLREVAPRWNFTGTARGQFTPKNLDSSERFSLGGPLGVRGYPSGEGTGDEGWMGSFNLNRALDDKWTVGGFVDVGEITVDRVLQATVATTPNRYALAAGGLTVLWRISPQTFLNATLAVPLGSNPAAQANGTNSDGSRNNPRLWLGLTAQL